MKKIAKYTDIKTVEDILQVNGLQELPEASALPFPEEFQGYMLNHFLRVLLVKALNKVFDPDWKPIYGDNSNEKYFPWPLVKADDERPSGFGFSGSGCDLSLSYAGVGSRLSLADPKLVLYALKQFPEIHIEDLLSI